MPLPKPSVQSSGRQVRTLRNGPVRGTAGLSWGEVVGLVDLLISYQYFFIPSSYFTSRVCKQYSFSISISALQYPPHAYCVKIDSPKHCCTYIRMLYMYMYHSWELLLMRPNVDDSINVQAQPSLIEELEPASSIRSSSSFLRSIVPSCSALETRLRL